MGSLAPDTIFPPDVTLPLYLVTPNLTITLYTDACVLWLTISTLYP